MNLTQRMKKPTIRTVLVSIVVAVLVASCYWQPSDQSGDIAIAMKISIPDEALRAAQLGALQTVGEPIEMRGPLSIFVVEERYFDADDAALKFRDLLEYTGDSPQPTGLVGYYRTDDVPYGTFTPADTEPGFSLELATSEAGASVVFNDLPLNRNYVVAAVATGLIPLNEDGEENCSDLGCIADYVAFDSIGITQNSVQAAPGAPSSVQLNLNGGFDLIFDTLRTRFNVPIVEAYQAGGTMTLYDPAEVPDLENENQSEVGGFAIEYLGKTNDSQFSHRIYIFEAGKQFNYGKNAYTETSPGAGRISPSDQGLIAEAVVEGPSLLIERPPLSFAAQSNPAEQEGSEGDFFDTLGFLSSVRVTNNGVPVTQQAAELNNGDFAELFIFPYSAYFGEEITPDQTTELETSFAVLAVRNPELDFFAPFCFDPESRYNASAEPLVCESFEESEGSFEESEGSFEE
jgi:hypothetical protein